MVRTLALSTLLLAGTLNAQNWTVGVQVDVPIGTIRVFGGGCSPGPQATLFIPLLPVTGVTYYYCVLNTRGGRLHHGPRPGERAGRG
jgi:hypothetical protein